MKDNRRKFLQTLGGAGLTIVSLPMISTLDIPSILELSNFSGDVDNDLDAILDRLESKSSAFVAQAAEGEAVEGSPQPLLSTPSALLNILDRLELSKSFSNRVDYRDASQCRKNFEYQEAMWRGNFGSFTNVQRAHADHDVAYFVAGNIDTNNHLVQAQGATQYQGQREIALTGDDPGVLLAAQPLINQGYSSTPRELAHGLAVTHKRVGIVRGDQVSTQYETPTSVITHFPNYRRRNSRVGRRSRGVVVAQNKRRNPNKIYFAEVYV